MLKNQADIIDEQDSALAKQADEIAEKNSTIEQLKSLQGISLLHPIWNRLNIL